MISKICKYDICKKIDPVVEFYDKLAKYSQLCRIRVFAIPILMIFIRIQARIEIMTFKSD